MCTRNIKSQLCLILFNIPYLLLLKLQILVLVGYPGSGKSFLANQIEKKSAQRYVAVCRDILGTWQKCAAKATELIKVDNFNVLSCY